MYSNFYMLADPDYKNIVVSLAKCLWCRGVRLCCYFGDNPNSEDGNSYWCIECLVKLGQARPMEFKHVIVSKSLGPQGYLYSPIPELLWSKNTRCY